MTGGAVMGRLGLALRDNDELGALKCNYPREHRENIPQTKPVNSAQPRAKHFERTTRSAAITGNYGALWTTARTHQGLTTDQKVGGSSPSERAEDSEQLR